jgi:hypothetical protein
MKVTSGVFLLVCTPLAMAKSDKAYPKEKVAEFVVEKLDVTSTPAAIRPKREKGEKGSAIMDMLRGSTTMKHS